MRSGEVPITLSMIATCSLINCNNPQLSPLNRVVTIIKEIRDRSIDAE